MSSYPQESGYVDVSGYLYTMSKMISMPLPSHQECMSSLRNVRDALYVLSGRWRLALILCLVQSPKRFNEIQHALTGISAKVLAKELKDLELNGFITRNVYPTTPVSIIYEAAEYSLTLRSVLGELSAWGGQHREKVREGMRNNNVSAVEATNDAMDIDTIKMATPKHR